MIHTFFWKYEMSQLIPEQMAYYLQHPGSVVGASGSLFGVLIAFGMYFPDQQLMLLFPPIPMKAKWMVALCIGKMIQNFSRELCAYLESGKRTQVYQLGVCLYPISKTQEEK